jgi:hypothetical protein
VNAPAKPKRPKRTREFLTPEVKRTLISSALMGAGHKPWIACGVAYTVAKMPINGTRNQRAMEKAIGEEIVREQAKREAWLARDFSPAPQPTLRLVYSRKGAP